MKPLNKLSEIVVLSNIINCASGITEYVPSQDTYHFVLTSADIKDLEKCYNRCIESIAKEAMENDNV
tara:strand:+ start:89 stop:289 length:201 start_codon:yes stop_codon:yes gene_type:complete